MNNYKIKDSTSGAFAHPEGETVEFSYESGTWTPSGDLDALALDSLVFAGLAEIVEGGKAKSATGASFATSEAPIEITAPEPDAEGTTNTEAQ